MPGAISSIAGAVAGAFASSAIAGVLMGPEGLVGEAILSGVLSSTEASLIATGAGALIGGATNILTQSVVGSTLGVGKKTNAASAAIARGALINAVSSYAGIPVPYGARRVGGVRILTEVTGDANQFLHVILVWGEGQINAVAQLYLDDVAITDPSFSGTVGYVNYTGTDGQAADPAAIAGLGGKWTASDTCSGLAYSYVQMSWNETLFPRGLPTITADLQGKLVYDPRDATTKYSNNPALCLREYLTNTRYGLKAPTAMIDDTAFSAAANDCDATMTIPTSGGGTTTQAKYTCDGLLDVDQTRLDNIRQLLSTCRGYLVYSGGQYKLKTDKLTSPVSFTLSEDNIVGGWSIQLPQKRSRANRVRASFIDGANLWQPNVAVVASSAYQSADGALVESQLDLPLVLDYYRAQAIAQQTLTQTRFGIAVQLTATIAAMQLEVGDVVPLTHSTPGWTAKPFRVVGTKLLSTDEVQLQLAEYDDSVYTTPVGSYVTPSAATNLPDVRNVPAPANFALASGTAQLFVAGDGTVVSRIQASWDLVPNIFVQNGGRIEVQFKKSADSAWIDAASVQGSLTSTLFGPVDDGVAYDVRIRARNSAQVPSSWNTITAYTVVGKSQPPSDVVTFTIDGLKLSWTPVSDADLDGYRIRINPGTRRSWGDAAWLHGQGTVQEPLKAPPFTMPAAIGGQATIMIKAVDTSGNESTNPAYIVTNLGTPVIANVVETFDRKSSAFPGTKTNGTVDGSGNLVANSTTLMWGANDQAAMWNPDSTTLQWATASYAQMTYEDRVTTSGSLVGSLVTLTVTAQGDPWSIEYRENSPALMWNPDPTTLMWATDSSTLEWDTPPYQTWPGQITAKDSIYDFLITTGQGTTQGQVTAFTITVDAPDKSEFLTNVAIGAGGTALPITKSYTSIKGVNLTLLNDGGSAVTAKQENTTVTGPTVKCYDTTNAATTGHVNALVQGY